MVFALNKSTIVLSMKKINTTLWPQGATQEATVLLSPVVRDDLRAAQVADPR